MRVGLIGSVSSSNICLQKLVLHNFEVVCVYGYVPKKVKNVSDYFPLDESCAELDVSYCAFTNINHHAEEIEKLNLDLLFVVGVSQLVTDRIIQAPKYGCVGFHPTLLPQGRGRAPVAWLVLNEKEGAATLFKLTERADEGGIFEQVIFPVTEDDDASTVSEKLLQALEEAFDKCLPSLAKGDLLVIEQDERKASWYGKRTPDDGVIGFKCEAVETDKLIKSSTHPHPGAFTFVNGQKLTVWKSKVENNIRIKGVVGRILMIGEQQELLVQCGAGLIWLLDYQLEYDKKETLQIGTKLGYCSQNSIHLLNEKIRKLEQYVENIGGSASR